MVQVIENDAMMEHKRNALMAALNAVAAGKDHEKWVVVPPSGTSATVFEALNDALKYLHEPFHADHLDTVDLAFAKLGLKRTSDRKDKVARALLTHFIPPHRSAR
jgi:hypothetical protein